MCVHVGGMYICQGTHMEQGTTCKSQLILPTVWFLGIKLRSWNL